MEYEDSDRQRYRTTRRNPPKGKQAAITTPPTSIRVVVIVVIVVSRLVVAVAQVGRSSSLASCSRRRRPASEVGEGGRDGRASECGGLWVGLGWAGLVSWANRRNPQKSVRKDPRKAWLLALAAHTSVIPLSLPTTTSTSTILRHW